MLVVSDATPLNILIRAGLADVLPALFGRVVIPPAVAEELTHPSTPAAVREAIRAAPAWLELRAPTSSIPEGPKGLGERQALALALELRADLLLADDKAARAYAASMGIAVTGTLGVLEAAAARGLVDLRASLDRVRAAGLFLSTKLIERALLRESSRDQRKT